MNLDAFLIADAAAAPEGKLSMLGGGITRISAPELPFLIAQLVVVARLKLDDEADLAAPHTAQIQMSEPGGGLMVDFPPFELTAEPRAFLEGEEIYANLLIAFGPLRFAREGIHHLVFRLDGQIAREMNLPVGETRG